MYEIEGIENNKNNCIVSLSFFFVKNSVKSHSKIIIGKPKKELELK